MKLLLDLIAPHNCIGCSAEGSLVCSDCLSSKIYELESSCFLCSIPTLTFNTCNKCIRKSTVASLYVVTEYKGLAKDLVSKLKFNNTKDAAGVMAQKIYSVYEDSFVDVDVVSYIPTATKRIRKRGYDQSELIAKKLAKLLSVNFVKTLVRTDQSRSVGSSKQQRYNAQEYRLIKELKDTNILLIDDVVTTGETFRRAASYYDESNYVIGAAFAKTLLK